MDGHSVGMGRRRSAWEAGGLRPSAYGEQLRSLRWLRDQVFDAWGAADGDELHDAEPRGDACGPEKRGGLHRYAEAGQRVNRDRKHWDGFDGYRHDGDGYIRLS